MPAFFFSDERVALTRAAQRGDDECSCKWLLSVAMTNAAAGWEPV